MTYRSNGWQIAGLTFAVFGVIPTGYSWFFNLVALGCSIYGIFETTIKYPDQSTGIGVAGLLVSAFNFSLLLCLKVLQSQITSVVTSLMNTGMTYIR